MDTADEKRVNPDELQSLLIEPYRPLREAILNALGDCRYAEAIAILDVVRAELRLGQARFSSCVIQER